ncbi:MAG: DEAD/DEAH box helicase, partial [Thermodesulfobacteriota bacterium]
MRKLLQTVRNRLRRLVGIDRRTTALSTEEVRPAEGEPDSSPLAADASEALAEAAVRRRRRRRKKGAGSPDQPAAEAVPAPAAAGVQEAWELDAFPVTPQEGLARFHDFALDLRIMHAIADLDFRYCTPIQAETLRETLAGRDLVGRAQTGTGKTAAFLVTIFQRLLAQPPAADRPVASPRALILAPTRELAIQIAADGETLSRHCPLAVVALFGGADYDKQQRAVESVPVDVVAATPGRLLDFIRNRIVRLDSVEILVIDEADRMLDMGFIPDVRRVVDRLPAREKRQTMLYSATINEDVKRLAYQWARNPVHVEIEPEQVAVETVRQVVYLVTSDEKFAVLYNLITTQSLERVMVFTNRRDETRRLGERLGRAGISCAEISGDVAQGKRLSTLERFRSGGIRVLVATDVAGRGVHIEGVSHVVNYNLPHDPEDYVHRIGRTGRAGASGIAVSFATEDEAFYLPPIEQLLGKPLSCT